MYIIRPGLIRGADGFSYEYDATQLIELYQVQGAKCVELHNDDPKFEVKFCRYVSEGHIFLYPRSDGNYSWIQK